MKSGRERECERKRECIPNLFEHPLFELRETKNLVSIFS